MGCCPSSHGAEGTLARTDGKRGREGRWCSRYAAAAFLPSLVVLASQPACPRIVRGTSQTDAKRRHLSRTKTAANAHC